MAKTITEETADRVGGGQCTPAEILEITTKLTDAYEALVDFTSHVMERVAGD